MTRFTTVNDVVEYVMQSDPEFDNLLTSEQVREIVQANRVNRYEEITEAELDAMAAGAYAAIGGSVPN